MLRDYPELNEEYSVLHTITICPHLSLLFDENFMEVICSTIKGF
jgi:hypothetical protein